MIKKDYRDLIVDNGYIDKSIVIDFLRNASISDILLIAEIGKNGLSLLDYRALQEAVDEAEIWEIKQEEYYQLREDDEDFSRQYDDAEEDFEEWFEEQGKL
jgi:hypothetical protein